MTHHHNLYNDQYSEPVKDIIEKMPKKFGIWITCIILTLFCLLLLFGWLIYYPDTVSGNITINARYSPIKLVAASSGRMTLFSMGARNEVKAGDYIAVIQNSADIDDVKKINELLTSYGKENFDLIKFFTLFPATISLGEVNAKYYAFVNAMQQAYDYKVKNVFQKQREGLQAEIKQLTKLLTNNQKLEITKEKNMHLAKNIADRDSILLKDKAGDQDDADHSKIVYLTSRETFQGVYNDIINTQQQINDCQNKLQQLVIQKNDKERQMNLDILSAFDDLRDNLTSWEQHYVFKSPINGKVEYLKFWTNNQFIQAGESVFTVIPRENKIIGQMELPANGAGKVKVGQDVIIKLENYPFQQFGYVRGRVNSVSLTSNTVKVSNDLNMNIYLANIDLPNGLTTNYGSKLGFKYELKGKADIVSKDERLIERFFDNLKSTTAKN